MQPVVLIKIHFKLLFFTNTIHNVHSHQGVYIANACLFVDDARHIISTVMGKIKSLFDLNRDLTPFAIRFNAMGFNMREWRFDLTYTHSI